jgi:hypothetical protein
LALIPLGIARARRHGLNAIADLPDQPATWHRVVLFFGAMTVVNRIIGSQLSYRAVERMETVHFCGQKLPRDET